MSSGSTAPALGFRSAQTMPPRTPATTCKLVAVLYGAICRASSIVSRDPYQNTPFSLPISSTPNSSVPSVISSLMIRFLRCRRQFFPASSCKERTASSQGW